jgi:hypothetical protein
MFLYEIPMGTRNDTIASSVRKALMANVSPETLPPEDEGEVGVVTDESSINGVHGKWN